ncbi:MAG: hypothetical protein DHS20C17_15050 [Cyclobacteriaceae bacterium]|nr:MAG: hypothetical protein DHS20C17_15050 [Cyclobacteriaceae bacterium]
MSDLHEYNTGRPELILKEYGRNIQKLVSYIREIKEDEKRKEYSHTLVELMKLINPALKDGNEFSQKLWDDLFIISDFKLEVDSPFPKPTPEVLAKKPETLGYNNHRLKYKHYGRNIELLVKQATEIQDPQERKDAIIYLGRLMRSFYGVWNKEVVDESVIVDHIGELSDGALSIDLDEVKENNLFEPTYKERPRRSGGGNGKRRSNKRRKSNN